MAVEARFFPEDELFVAFSLNVDTRSGQNEAVFTSDFYHKYGKLTYVYYGGLHGRSPVSTAKGGRRVYTIVTNRAMQKRAEEIKEFTGSTISVCSDRYQIKEHY